MSKIKETMLLCLSDSCKLTKKISEETQINYHQVEKIDFADGECLLWSPITVRNKHIFVVSSFSKKVNNRIIETLILIDSLKRAGAAKISLILTYYGYARQDRKAKARQPITAKLIADLIQVSGVQSLTTVDLHNPSIQGFFDIPTEDVKGLYILANRLIKKFKKFTIVSPDYGGATRARRLAEILNIQDIAIINKKRVGTNQIEIFGIIGDVKGKNIVLIDDIIDTGSSILRACRTLKEEGAKQIIVIASHGIFSKGFEIFETNPDIEEVIVTDSVDQSQFLNYKKHKVTSLAGVLSKVIIKQINSESLSKMYEEYRQALSKEIK